MGATNIARMAGRMARGDDGREGSREVGRQGRMSRAARYNKKAMDGEYHAGR
jgi:hypothetical protein